MSAVFVLATTKHGPMIQNRFEHDAELLTFGEYQPGEANALGNLMHLRRQHFGDEVVVLDVGANVGAHTVRWARGLAGWGRVIAVEAQEHVFYALAGNVALNNLFNVRAMHAVVGAETGRINIPTLDHCRRANFGGLHLRPTDRDPGQPVSYAGDLVDTALISVDSLRLPRLDMMKIDVEGMELEVLDGAQDTIEECRPVIYAEHTVCGMEGIKARLPGYRFMEPMGGQNVLCIHNDDPLLAEIR
jgi:FkbM family methyltransferase